MLLGHFCLLLVCAVTFRLALAAFNFLLLALALFAAAQAHKIMNAVKIVRRNEGLGRRQFTSDELRRWRSMYAHPAAELLGY